MSLQEIVLPITKPETEWVRGRALQKTGGTYAHSAAQMEIAIALLRWAESGHRGRVAPSWRFRVMPPGGPVRPLAPDVAFLSYRALSADAPSEAVEVPLGTPTVAIEVLSEDDLDADVIDKLATYLSAGCSAIIVVDPERRTMAVHDSHGTRLLRAGDTISHAALPGFALDVNDFFSRSSR